MLLGGEAAVARHRFPSRRYRVCGMLGEGLIKGAANDFAEGRNAEKLTAIMTATLSKRRKNRHCRQGCRAYKAEIIHC